MCSNGGLSTAQHSTHSTAQHSVAKHSTAPSPSCRLCKAGGTVLSITNKPKCQAHNMHDSTRQILQICTDKQLMTNIGFRHCHAASHASSKKCTFTIWKLPQPYLSSRTCTVKSNCQQAGSTIGVRHNRQRRAVCHSFAANHNAESCKLRAQASVKLEDKDLVRHM